MLPVLHLPLNTKGRDIVTGDVHGSFRWLKTALKAVNFDKHKDRLIIAGDLVDRGENSIVAKEWIEQPWCYGVMGNHDAQYAFIDDHLKFSKGICCMPVDTWYTKLGKHEFRRICKALRENLHPAIEIETEASLVGVTHATVPEGLDWGVLRERLNNKDYDLLHECMWGRDLPNLAQRGIPEEEAQAYHIKDVAHVFHGHTPAKKLGYLPYRLSNRYFVDTGAYLFGHLPSAGITLFDARYPEKPIYSQANCQ